jgi:hypothetical protein
MTRWWLPDGPALPTAPEPAPAVTNEPAPLAPVERVAELLEVMSTKEPALVTELLQELAPM